MSEADLSSAAPDPSSSAPAPPTFIKRKKRTQARTLSLREHLQDGTASPEGGATPREGTPGSGFEGDAEDSTSETLDSLLALRKLKRSTAGLELDRLNAGERKKRPKVSQAEGEGGGGDGTVTTKEGMIEGTQGGLRSGGAGKDRLRDDGDAPEAKARKIVKSDNFTGQTNTVDVDKHMLAYIDAELARKRAGGSSTPDPSSAAADAKPHDPRDDLYRVSDKYRFLVTEEEKQVEMKKKEDEEGNVTLSASMLMGIPEVDLGIDTKLKNIEDTEKAKRRMYEDQQRRREERRAAELAGEADEFAVDRFYRARRPLESDTDALARARADAARAADPAQNGADPDYHMRGKDHNGGGSRGQGQRAPQTATDDLAMARFKKRQMQQFKK
ncbi:hypothetical protein JCM6882_005134 [Rhodosporidiobolus microsporus]